MQFAEGKLQFLSKASRGTRRAPAPRGTLHGEMTPPFCNVALPVPLRTMFTYAVPDALQGTVQPGSRVLVPFRKKAMVGVVVELAENAPQGTQTREITPVLDFVPAFPPNLIELAL